VRLCPVSPVPGNRTFSDRLPPHSAVFPLSLPGLCPVAPAFRPEAFPRLFPFLVYGTLTPVYPELRRAYPACPDLRGESRRAVAFTVATPPQTVTPPPPQNCHPDRSGPTFPSRRLLVRRAAQWRDRGAPLCSPFFLLASLCELCVPISVISVLPSLFSANSASSAPPRPELRGAQHCCAPSRHPVTGSHPDRRPTPFAGRSGGIAAKPPRFGCSRQRRLVYPACPEP